MKIRTNFVSNSSSSSFIVGYGVLKPETRKECLDVLQKCAGNPNNWNGWNTKLACSLEEGDRYLGFVEFYVDTYGMESTDEVLLVQIENNEGDCNGAFFNPPLYESGWEQAESKDFYDENQQKVIEILDNSKYIDLSKPHNWKIGAERNG